MERHIFSSRIKVASPDKGKRGYRKFQSVSATYWTGLKKAVSKIIANERYIGYTIVSVDSGKD